MQIEIPVLIEISETTVRRIRQFTGYTESQISTELTHRFHTLLESLAEEHEWVFVERSPNTAVEPRWFLYPASDEDVNCKQPFELVYRLREQSDDERSI